jgi:hypothetical protein
MPRSSHFFYFITLTVFCEEYKLRSTSLCNFLHPTVTLSFLAACSQTPFIPSAFNARVQISHEYKATGKDKLDVPKPAFAVFEMCHYFWNTV